MSKHVHNTIAIIHSTVCPIVYISIKGLLSTRSDLGVVELHGVVCGQRHNQAFLVELQQRVLGVLQEQAVVAERGHGDWDLGQEVQVLQHGALVEEKRGGTGEDFTLIQFTSAHDSIYQSLVFLDFAL